MDSAAIHVQLAGNSLGKLHRWEGLLPVFVIATYPWMHPFLYIGLCFSQKLPRQDDNCGGSISHLARKDMEHSKTFRDRRQAHHTVNGDATEP